MQIARKPRQLTQCNCSICRRYGALWAYYSRRTVRIVSGREARAAYTWRNGTLEFYHCKNCGCVTHHERARKRPDTTVAVNARMMDPEVIAALRIRKLDGASTWRYLEDSDLGTALPSSEESLMAKSKKQAQALGIKLSRERRSGKEIPPPSKSRYSEKTRQKALRDLEVGRQRKRAPAKKRRTGK